MNWFKKLMPSKITSGSKKSSFPEGLWSKCPSCDSFLFKSELEKNLNVCPKCNHHIRISARTRLSQVLDPEPRVEIGEHITPVDRLKFKDTKRYKDRLSVMQKKTGETDALVVMRGQIDGLPLVACAFEFAFIGGSMGAVVGERFVLAVRTCLEQNIPLVCFACSGGARMQESLISLMQMSKTSAALGKLQAAGLPYISVLVDPCTGGVSASLAMLGDLNIAEPKATIGFAGRKVIEQTVRETLPDNFQTSEFLLEKGFVDIIVDRRDMRDTLKRVLTKMLYYRYQEQWKRSS